MTKSQVSYGAKLVVTGSSGFVGRHFCAQFGGIPLADQNGSVDLRDPVRVRSVLASVKPSAVLHLAAQSSVAMSFKDPATTFSVNFLGTLNLLQALSAIDFRGVFLYVGSADVYGRIEEMALPARESYPLRPRSPYAVSKVAAESLCFQWSQTGNFRVVMARPFNQIGPGQSAQFAIADFARQIAAAKLGGRRAALVTGDLDITRDFTDVRDAVHAYHALLLEGENGEIYNICSGHERSLRSLVEEMLRISEVHVELQTEKARLRSSEQRRMIGDLSKIHSLLGWSPQIPITTTLTDILRHAEETI